MNVAVRPVPAWRHSRGVIVDLAGLPVDASGPVWRLNSVRTQAELDWGTMPIRSHDLLSATVDYIATLIKSRATDSVFFTFRTLLFVGRSQNFVRADTSGDVIPYDFFEEVGREAGIARWRLHYVRHWYRFCADLGHDRFSSEVAFELERKTLGGNDKGHAVLSLDPEEGPLNDLEMTALLAAMRSPERSGKVPLDAMTALWLCVAYGPNPLQLALLREEDVRKVWETGQDVNLVRMPRIKKRTERPRAECRDRKLVGGIATTVLALVEDNQARRATHGWSDPRHALPLLVRPEPRGTEADDPMAEYARHLYSSEVTALVAKAVKLLQVVSPRTGHPLRVTCRRLRYTYATRLVREGASMHAVADALDHTDLQNVRCYFNVRSDIVESLDKALALALGPVAQAFMGKLVRNESEAERGGDPRSRVRSRDRETGEALGLGTCGQHSFCNYLAPVACYTCDSFQPWMDGPHERILADLLAQRERRVAAGQDGRMASLHDATILAVADVVDRIAKAGAGATA